MRAMLIPSPSPLSGLCCRQPLTQKRATGINEQDEVGMIIPSAVLYPASPTWDQGVKDDEGMSEDPVEQNEWPLNGREGGEDERKGRRERKQ